MTTSEAQPGRTPWEQIIHQGSVARASERESERPRENETSREVERQEKEKVRQNERRRCKKITNVTYKTGPQKQ